MKKKTFLNQNFPLNVCMVQADNPQRIKALMDYSLPLGAEAFGIQLCRMKPQNRNKDVYKELFEYSEKPIYVTNYRSAENGAKNDEALANELIELADCGATLCDVMGDYFDECESQLTMKGEAIQKQMRLIDELHKIGKEVIMSSHVMKFTPAEEVLKIAFEHKRRGADISKIVTYAENMRQQIENMRIANILKEELGIPFLFLSGGECHIFRRLAWSLGNCMSLCVYEHDHLATPAQPLLSDMIQLQKILGVK